MAERQRRSDPPSPPFPIQNCNTWGEATIGAENCVSLRGIDDCAPGPFQSQSPGVTESEPDLVGLAIVWLKGLRPGGCSGARWPPPHGAPSKLAFALGPISASPPLHSRPMVRWIAPYGLLCSHSASGPFNPGASRVGCEARDCDGHRAWSNMPKTAPSRRRGQDLARCCCYPFRARSSCSRNWASTGVAFQCHAVLLLAL